jgi:predicted flap endonuclease-1-like 5' DNA nuclease
MSIAGIVGLAVAALAGFAAGWFVAARARDRAVAAARETATAGTFQLADELYARTRRATELESKLAAARQQAAALKEAVAAANERAQALEAEAEARAVEHGPLERELAHARARLRALEAAAGAPPALPAPEAAPRRARRPSRLPENPRPARRERTEGDGHDDLKLIPGVGPALERLLHRNGIHTYRQIANWTREDVEAMTAKRPALNARIRRDDWIAGARREHRKKYGTDP